MLWKRSRWEVRAAKVEELALLQADLAKDKRWEQLDLSRSIVCVTTYDGKTVMYASARLVWQIEPLKWMEDERAQFAELQQAKATYITIRWLRDWLTDLKNNPFIRAYFCLIGNNNPGMQKLAISFGMRRLYQRVKFFGEYL